MSIEETIESLWHISVQLCTMHTIYIRFWVQLLRSLPRATMIAITFYFFRQLQHISIKAYFKQENYHTIAVSPMK